MDKKDLKTGIWQRVVIVVIAILLLGSTILTYMFVFMNNSETAVSGKEARAEELMAEYDAKNAEITAAAQPLSDKYFPEFKKYISKIKAYNEANANNAVLKHEDLKVGTGKELTEGDTDYLAYYVGWCADGSIFDSSFNTQGQENSHPNDATSLNPPIDPSSGLIEGWNQGVIGMKIGGVRELTISGDLAYGDTRSICGGLNKPLKFIVMAIEPDANLVKLREELQDIYLQLYMSYYSLSGDSSK